MTKTLQAGTVGRVLLFGTLIICTSFCPLALGSESYPAKPLRLVVPFPPGGGTDLLSRAIAQNLSSAWGQTVVVDNRPGAGTNIGTDIVAKSLPDGYTMLMSSFG